MRNAISETTRAVTTHAPASDVWPWLVQLGAGRGGLYSYDRAERLLGVNIRNADQILPQFQRIEVGDTIWVTPEGYPANLAFKVGEVTPERSLVLEFAKEPHAHVVPSDPGWTWSFVLQPVDARTTRLVLRDRQASMGNPVTDAFMGGLVDPIGFVMTRKMLLGIADRAERHAGVGSAWSPAEPFLFSLLVLGAAGAVAIAVTRRRPWWWRLGIAAVAASALSQMLLRGFPNPWYAVMADLGIAAVMGITYRRPRGPATGPRTGEPVRMPEVEPAARGS